MKRVISLILVFAMLLGILPIGEMLVFADDGAVVIKDVEVRRTYNGPQDLNAMYIKVIGENLDKVGRKLVIVQDKWGNPTGLSAIEENKWELYYKIEAADIEGISTMSVGGVTYEIGGGDIPDVTGINPSAGIVTNGGTITIKGGDFSTFESSDEGNISLQDPAGKDVYLGEIGSIEEGKEGTITKAIPELGIGGSYTLKLIHKHKKDVGENEVEVTLIDNYVDIYTVHGKLPVSDDIRIVPNQGPTGTTVKIIGKELLKPKDMSVFFLKATDGTDPYTVNNMGTDETYSDSGEKDKDDNPLNVFTVKVPKGLEQGRYHVVLTNNVNEGVDPAGRITNVKELEDMFTVVDNLDTLSIINVSPSFGPESGEDVTIMGKNIGTMSGNIFKPNPESVFKVNEDTQGGSSTSLEITYDNEAGDGSEVIGKYDLIGGKDGVDVKRITREITVFVGGRASFRKGSSFTKDSDKLEVRTPNVTIGEDEDRRKDVTVRVDTEIKYKDGEGEDTLTITETGTWSDGKFEFQPIYYKPEIDSITPERIPVKANNEIIDDLELHISGKNFFKHRYVNKDGDTKIKYPVIYLGDQAILDPNIDTKDNANNRIPISSENIKIYDKSGIEIDGTDTNNLGTKISIKIPKGIDIDKGAINQPSELTVKNPIKNDEDITNADPEDFLGLSDKGSIRFIKVVPARTPIITGLNPRIVTTDGKEKITITGSNFDRNVNLYLDGEHIKDVKRNGTGTELTFTTDPKPEGIYQIIVQNESGGIATDKLIYVKTYTDIKLIDFVPKKGAANTLVTVSGENFVLPNPAVEDLSGMGIYKLIGTRIQLGRGNDINEYQLKDGVPSLEAYTVPDSEKPFIYIEDNKVKASDYYHSIILRAGTEADVDYYTLYFDTFEGSYKLTNGDKEEYIVGINKEEKLIGKKDGKEYTLDVSNSKLTIKGEDVELKYTTPYELTDGKITGNKVTVKDKGELVFEVPPLSREGYYDLVVENPDTKKDSKTANSGFYYSFQPEYNPVIGTIEPEEGSTEGGYFIDIKGEGFLDRGGDEKTSVTIGTVEVDSKDITVSPDGNKLTVRVPEYPGKLETETEMDRKTVAVVVTNPDGGSASKRDGFTYIIPISHPKITNLILNEGSAAGGESVYVEGSQFRFFEPYIDENNNGSFDEDEDFSDKNNNGRWDDYRYWFSPENKAKYDKIIKDGDFEELIRPVLPKVYFGSEQAKVIGFSASSIEVETPKGQDGTVDVYVVNNDHGTSNKLKYTYKGSQPKIDTIVPNVGRKQGNDKLELLGSSFYNSDVLIIEDKETAKNDRMPIVQFGSLEDTKISNKSISIDAPKDSGRIRDGKSKVNVGNLTVDYDVSGTNTKLLFKITEGSVENKKEYTFTYETYKGSEVFLPTSLLKDAEGEKHGKEGINSEYIRVRLDTVEGTNATKRVRVDRGFALETKLLNSGHISLKTPSYYTIGQTKLRVINPDGGIAKGDFIYKNPDSNPNITNILRDTQEGKTEQYVEDGELKTRKIVRVNIDGGNNIDILGTDFRKPVQIKIGDIPAITQGIVYDPSNEPVSQKMSFRMPQVDESYVNKIHRVVIENEDGGTAGSDSVDIPIYIQFIKGETPGLDITKIDPEAGTSEGGTEITISGKDFRKSMEGFEGENLKVYFGTGGNQVRVPDSNIDWKQTNTSKIVLTTPPHPAGKVSIKVENPDGSIVEKDDAYTYVSNPKLTNIVDPLNGDIKKEFLSIEGNETIKLKGSDFMEGARVIFNPKLTKVSSSPQATGEKIFIDGVEYYYESGTLGTEIEYIDSNNIKVKTPSGQLETGGVIVINSDGAATPIYNIKYKIPEITHPQDVRASLIQDEYIRINWNEVVDTATDQDGKQVQYEIYAVKGNTRQFIGSTANTGFVFRDIEPNTTYKFLVRAVGKYGSSKPINESMSNEVSTGRNSGPSDDDGELGENTTSDKSGDTANVVIGKDAFDKSGQYTIDLTKGTLAGSNNLVVSMSADTITSKRFTTIKVVGKDFGLSFSPSVFETPTIKSNTSNKNAGVRFQVKPVNQNFDLKENISYTVLSTNYLLDANVYIGSHEEKMENLMGDMKVQLDYNLNIANSRKITPNLVKYDIYDRRFKTITNRGSYGTSTENIRELGTYTTIGSRRL